jgi:hypothetical protein
MHINFRHITALLVCALMAACSSSPSDDAASGGGTPSKGKAVDGYLAFSKVVCDTNGNGQADPDEAVTFTNTKGEFVFASACVDAQILTTGGTNADTGLAFVGQLRAPKGATMVTPLTTLMAASGMSKEELNTALGLPPGTDILSKDPAATDPSTGALLDSNLLKKGVAVQQIMQKTTEMFGGLGKVTGSIAINAAFADVAAALSKQLKSGTPLFDASGTISTVAVGAMITEAINTTSNPEIQKSLAKYGGASVLTSVVQTALVSQAQAIMNAAPGDITAVTLDRQSNTSITDFVKKAATDGLLKPGLSSQDIANLQKGAQGQASQPTKVSVPAPASGSTTLLNFDESPVAFTNMGGYGGALPSTEVPTGSDSGLALKITKPASDVTWGGIYFGVNAIPFTSTRKTITAAVYATRANAVIKLKVEAADKTSVEVDGTATGQANTWTTVTWVLSGVDASKEYKTVAITPDAELTTSGQVYYIDNLALAPAGTSSNPGTNVPTKAVPAPAGGSTTLLNFDESPVGFADMGGYGGALPSTEVPTGSDSGLALKITKPANNEKWGGIYFGVNVIPFTSTRKTITAAVYATRANAVIKLKVEATDKTSVEVEGTTTGQANTWTTVTWVLSGADTFKQYKIIAITPDAELTTSGQVYYIDNLALAPAGTSPPPAAVVTDYVYLQDNSIGFSPTGSDAAIDIYSMSDFMSESGGGIKVRWPMSNAAAVKLRLKINGSFSFSAGQTLSAAVKIEETGSGKHGELRAFTDNVLISKSGDSVTLSVPTQPQALIYSVSSDGATKAVIDFSSKVKGITNTLSLTSGTTSTTSTVMFGEVVNFAINGLSNQFNSMYAMRGKYKVTIVVNELPLKKADGSAFSDLTISVPTSVSAGVEANPIPVNGKGLVGYITLTD